MVKEIFLKILDFLFTLVTQVLEILGSMLNFNPSEYIHQIPPEVTDILGLLGIGSCITIITTALILRMVLQMIPFVRIGS